MAKNNKYDISAGRAYTADSGIINDSIGSVSYAYKTNSKILLENLSSNQNSNLKTPGNSTLININAGTTNTIDCFYNLLSKKSVYNQPIKEGKTVTLKTVTKPTINVYKVKLSATIFVLEVRNNDPWVLTGLDSAPLDVFKSLAIAKSENDAIKAKVAANNFLASPMSFDFETPEVVSNTGERKYYKSRLSIIGSKNEGGAVVRVALATDTYVYSIDKCNWTSVAYASAAFNKIPGYVWDNQIIPNPIGTNPFAAYWSNGSTGLKDRLTLIIGQANNLSVANDNKGYRLLNTPIRDYIYQGDIDNVTFEMAFRLSFFIESIKDTPYESVGVNGKFNNPYYKKFDDWFGYANGLRTAAGIVNLNEAGKLKTEYDVNYHDYNAVFESLLQVSPKYRSYFIENLVPAYIAKNFDFENKSFINTVHLPWPQGSINKKGAVRNLSELVNSAMITASVKTKLENDEVRFAKIPDGTYSGEVIKNGYVAQDKKDKKAKKFYVYTYSWNLKPTQTNSSGLTFGFGYDLGANSNLQAFKNYTGFNVPDTGLIHDAVTDGLGKKKIDAMHNYFKYYDSVWNTEGMKIKFEKAVKSTVPIMKGAEYMTQAVNTMAKNYIINGAKTDKLYLRTFQVNFKFFFDEGSGQFLNEVEKVLFLSQVWNTGAGSCQPYSKKNFLRLRAKRLIHAFNTHDIKYLKYATKESNIAHKQLILDLLEVPAIFNYFKNIK